MIRLNEFDRAEWQDVAKALRPDWSEADFDRAWIGFQREKARRSVHA